MPKLDQANDHHNLFSEEALAELTSPREEKLKQPRRKKEPTELAESSDIETKHMLCLDCNLWVDAEKKDDDFFCPICGSGNLVEDPSE